MRANLITIFEIKKKYISRSYRANNFHTFFLAPRAKKTIPRQDFRERANPIYIHKCIKYDVFDFG